MPEIPRRRGVWPLRTIALALASASQAAAACPVPNTRPAAADSGPARHGADLDARRAGAVADGVADDWWALQRAIDSLAAQGGGTLVLSDPSPGHYRISQALRLRSDVTVRVPNQATRIACTGNPSFPDHTDPTGADATKLGQWPTYSCVLLGGYESGSIADIVPDALRHAGAGQDRVQFARPGAAGAYAVGDVVSLQTATSYRIGLGAKAYPVATWRQMDVVAGVDVATNTLALRHTLQAPLADGEVLRLSNGAATPHWPHLRNASGGDTGVPLWATHDAAVLGGTWDGGTRVPFSTGSGAVDCRIAVHEVIGLRGVGYGNMLGGCRFAADLERVAGVVAELSEGSHDNSVVLGRVEAVRGTGHGPDEYARYLGANEAARHNSISVGQLLIGATDGLDVVQLWNAVDTTVCIGSVEGEALQGSLVMVDSLFDTPAAPPSRDNHVDIKTSTIGRMLRAISVVGRQTSGTVVSVGSLRGDMTDPRGNRLTQPQSGPPNSIAAAGAVHAAIAN